MVRVYPKIKKVANAAFLYFQKKGNGKHEHILLKIGEYVVIEGGASTGKTQLLEKTMRKLDEVNERYVFINAMLPIGDWVKEYKLFGKNLEARVNYFIKVFPEKAYLIIDNAEKITDSRKLEIVLSLMSKARSVIFACSSFSYLNDKLRARLKDATIHSLGAGANTFDITYFVVAILIIFVALSGNISLVFLAAALRYLFQGTRMGGKRI